MREQETCGILLPTFEVMLNPNQELCPCIRLAHRNSPHRSRLPDGRVVEWFFECADEADGKVCSDPEDCEDFVYEIVNEKGGT